MKKDNTDIPKPSEKLFMLELVIQKVFIDVLESADFEFYTAETCMSYKFLDNGPFKICERDFKSKIKRGCCAGCNNLRNGNSTMLALFPEQIRKLQVEGFNIEVEVIKMLKPIPKTIGTTQVPMKEIFISVLETMAKKNLTTDSKSMKNRYKLKDDEGDPIGYVDLFIRFSCMGKMIVTKFQMDTERECVEFQSNTGNKYKYEKKTYPDPFLCRPCGKPAKPVAVKKDVIPKNFPEFRVTEAMKQRLQERRYKELGIKPPQPPPPKKQKPPSAPPKKQAGKGGAAAPPPPAAAAAPSAAAEEIVEAAPEEPTDPPEE